MSFSKTEQKTLTKKWKPIFIDANKPSPQRPVALGCAKLQLCSGGANEKMTLSTTLKFNPDTYLNLFLAVHGMFC